MQWFKKLFSKNKKDDELVVIHNTLKRINENRELSPSMVGYANRLVDCYLPAIQKSFHSCDGFVDPASLQFCMSPKEAHSEIMMQIEKCLVDIEHGAQFKDDLYDVFFDTLIRFEQKISERCD